jgi:hypothetical protein
MSRPALSAGKVPAIANELMSRDSSIRETLLSMDIGTDLKVKKDTL